MKSLLELIKLLYGPKAISSTIGTRTNVIRLPSGKLQKYLSKDLNIEAASDAAAVNAYKEMEELIPEVAKMNDGERLVFEGNLRRLKNKLEDSGLIQKENVSSGITALESKVEQLRQAGKELEKVTGEKATLTDVLNDLRTSQQSMSRLNDEGLVRAAARQILINDIKAGKIKNITVSEAINMGEPLDPFRQIYGEGALEQLDSLIPNFRGLKTEMEAEKLARSKFKFEPDENRLPGSVSIEEGRKAEQEFGINKPAKVSDFKAEATKRTSIDDLIDEYNANQDKLRLSDEEGGTAIGYQEFKNIQKRNEDIAKALEEKGISSKVEEAPQAEIIQFRKKPTEPEGKADGGRIGYAYGTPAMGLDYLTGMEPSKGYADGGRIGFKIGSGKKIINKLIKKIKKPTKDDYEDYAEILNDSENTVVQGIETFDELDALVKKQKDYEASMYQEYKMGRLDPSPGDKSEGRMKFLRKKAEEAEMTGDRRLITPDEMDELSDLESTYLQDVDKSYGTDTAIKKEMKKAIEEGTQKTNRMTELGLNPSSSKDYDKFLEMESIKQKYGNVIDDNLLKQILVDDNPQRKAEVLASIDEAIHMQQKGIAPEEIINIIKNTTRTKQAKGGSIGLNYLMGL
jgi:cell division protein ZapA (FtsZ GTPase activity inhibitor)